MAEMVYRDYTREELDRQYSNFLQEGAEAAHAAATARCLENHAAMNPQTGIAYGPASDQVFDLYRAESATAPAILYMHGGQWQKGDASMSAVAADTAVAAGVSLVAMHCQQIPDVRLPDMVDQTVALIRHVRADAAALGVDPTRLCVAGHSSGAHLAGAALVRLANENDLAGIACGLLISGNYDLRPLMLSYRADYLKLTDAETFALSPLLTLDRPPPPLWLTVGSVESDEFRRQTSAFHAAVSKIGSAEHREVSGRNHFNANDELRMAGSPLWHFLGRHLDLDAAARTAAQ
jgi:arylformamidase